MSRYNKFSLYSLLTITTISLTACGGSNNKATENPTSRPQFKWANVAVSNNFSPLGDTNDRTPTFTWQAYTSAGQLATRYNFGYQDTNGTIWREYTVAAAGAGCASGGTCSYKPTDHTFNIGDQRVWWVRGEINGTWQEWSSAHVFKVINTTPPPSGAYTPVGDTGTLKPIFKWPKVGSASSYELGFETQSGTNWTSFSTVNCQAANCAFTPSYNFTAGEKYTWWIRPTAGSWSNGVNFTVTAGNGGGDTQAPSIPTSLRKTAATSSTTSIRWNASTDNVAVTGYRIYRNGSQVGTTTATNFNDSNLSPSTRYTYTIRAFDAANNLSANSSSLVVTTENNGGTTTLTPFTWSPINGASSYTFGIERQNGTGWREYSRTASQLNCQSGMCSFIPTDYGLNVGDQVVWFVKPNIGNWSAAHISTVTGSGSTDTQAPSTPANLRSTTTTATRASIRWNASTDNTAVTGYRVYRNGIQIGTVSEASFNDSNVMPATTYIYTVSAFDAANNISARSNSLSVIIPQAIDTQAPTVPSNVRLTSATTNKVDIRWNASTDNRAVTGYKIYRNNIQVATSSTANFSDTNVRPSTDYTYTVSAFDAAGNNSTRSSVLSVTTPPVIQPAALIINEVLAGNTSINMDTDYYAFSDWIELYNGTNQSMNISGYYLSDDATNAKKWKIPMGTTLGAKQYLLVWADKKNTKAKELHTNFSLSSKGETVTLADTTGSVINTITYKKLPSNVSVAKSGSSLSYFVPTPKTQNGTSYSDKKGSVKPNFDNASGFYSSRLNLQLSQQNGAEIYYTTDGSTPTIASTRYNGTITLDNTTVVKAIALTAGKLPSDVVTNTYFINHQTTLPVVSLSMNNDYLFDDTVGIYTIGTNGTAHTSCNNVVANYAQEWDRPVFVEYFDNNHNRALAFGADTGLTGECSRRKTKKSFGFELDGKYGTKSLSYKLFPGKNLGKIKDFKVRTANSGYRVGDIIGAQLIEQGGLDIDYQAYRAVQMFMNGEYWGIYNIREKKGAETLEANYPNLGKVDIIKAFIVKKGDYTAYGQFNTFLSTNNLSTTANYQQALTFFDESNFIDYMAFMIYNGNLDWIGGNMRTWKEKKAGAKWRWMADDIDWGFLAQLDFAGQGTALAANQFNNIKNSGSTTNMALLFNGLMKNNAFKTKFKTRFTTLLNTVFTADFMLPIINQINDERKDYMRLEKFAGMPAGDYVASYNDYIENDLRSFVRQRTAIVKQQLEQAIP